MIVFFSTQSNEFKEMVNSIRNTEDILGFIDFKIPKNARSSLNGKRSIYVVKDIKKGEVFNEENIKDYKTIFWIKSKIL